MPSTHFFSWFATGGGGGPVWILTTGIWVDGNEWVDTANWID
jgi:hypothetical protein